MKPSTAELSEEELPTDDRDRQICKIHHAIKPECDISDRAPLTKTFKRNLASKAIPLQRLVQPYREQFRLPPVVRLAATDKG